MSKNVRNLAGVVSTIIIAILLTPRMNLAKSHKYVQYESEPAASVAKSPAASSAHGLELSGSFEDEVLKSKMPVVVDFYAPWCGPCKNLAPIFEEVSKNPAYVGKVKFVKINTEGNNRAAAQQYQVRSIPEVLFFKNGQVVHRNLGGMSKEKLERLVKESFGL